MSLISHKIDRRTALGGLLGLIGLGGSRSPDVFRLATFSADVTIPLGHACMGGGIAPAKEVLDPLFAHGFVLRGAGRPVAVVAVDWCEIRNAAYDRFRARIDCHNQFATLCGEYVGQRFVAQLLPQKHRRIARAQHR